MKVIETFPPNIELINAAGLGNATALYCYGDTIFNPGKRDITPDLEFHEEQHSKRQGTDPDGWWAKYLTDPAFRLAEELQAYGAQYVFAKSHIEEQSDKAYSEGMRLALGKTKLLDWALDSMAKALSGQSYGNLISFAEARSKIRNYSRS